MPLATTTINTTAGTSLVKKVIPIEKGSLVSVTAFDNDLSSLDCAAFCQLGINYDGDTAEQRGVILASGLVGGSAFISWHGNIPTEPAMQLHIIAQSRLIITINISILTSNIGKITNARPIESII